MLKTKLVKKPVNPVKLVKKNKKSNGGLSQLNMYDKHAIINNVINIIKKNKCIINFCGANNYAKLKNILYNNAFKIPQTPSASAPSMPYSALKQMYPISNKRDLSNKATR